MEFGPIFRSLLRSRARVILIVAEVALTLAIVANCLSLILDTRAQLAKPSGLDDEHLIAIQATPFDDRLRDPKILGQLVEQDRRTLRAVAGVRAVSHTSLRPWERSGSITAVRLPGTRNEPARTQSAEADPGLFDTLGLPIVQGRGFTQAEYDQGGDAPLSEVQPVVVSRALADHLYPGGGAVGKPIADADESQRFTIVGIVDHFYNPFGETSEKVMLLPARSASFDYGSRYLVRTQGSPAPLMSQLEKALLVLVTARGIVGLTSFSVAERQRQIGTRRALGADRLAIVRHFLLENWMVTSFGVVLGVLLAYGLNFGIVTWVAGAKLSPATVAAGALTLWMIGLGAALGPALRGARVPPAIATRNV